MSQPVSSSSGFASASLHLQDGERAQTNQHYDQDPRVFRHFLDSTLKYSSALYRGDSSMDLYQAQLRKMDFIAAELGVRSGDRVLDIGCGWGSVTLHLAKNYGCHVTAVTPAPHQAEYVRGKADELGIAAQVRVVPAHFQETEFADKSFHHINMVGSLVHFRDKPATLAECYRLCRTRGRVYFSDSCFRNAAKKAEFDYRPGTNFIRDEIFGWGDLILLSDYVRYFEDAGFALTALHDLTADYYETIEQWQKNARANRDALDRVEPGLTDKLIKYFEICNAGWGYTTKHYALVARRAR